MKLAKQESEMAFKAINCDCVVAMDSAGAITPIEQNQPVGAGGHRYGPIVGVVCPPGTAAVAYPFDVCVNYAESAFDSRIAVVVSRRRPPLVIDSDGEQLHPLAVTVPLIDLGRRALGMATPEPDEPLVHLLDRIWLDRVLAAVLESDLGANLSWRVLFALHPALPQLCAPESLPAVRQHFRSSWSHLRQQVALSHIHWPGMVPAVAEWLDDGSFARWCLADTPEPQPIMSDLSELLDPTASRHMRRTLDQPLIASSPSRDRGQE